MDISFAYEGAVQLDIGDSHCGKLYKEEVIGNLEHGGPGILVPLKSSMSES
jgi:hypothetical protein